MSMSKITGEVVSRQDLDALLASICPEADIDDEYNNFYTPSLADIKYMLAECWNPVDLCYGSIRPDWPLCYDFAELAAAAVRLAAYKANWPERAAFGVVRYTKNSGQRHAINFTVLDDCHILYFESQTGEWMEQPDDLKSVENLYI